MVLTNEKLNDEIQLTEDDNKNGDVGKNGTAGADDPVATKKAEHDEEEKAQIPFSQLFRYATAFDWFLIILGTFWAALHGAGWPVLAVVFGEMTDSFLDFDNVNLTVNDSQIIIDTFLSEMNKYAVYYMYIGLGMFGASLLQIACWMVTCERQVHQMRQNFFHAILRQDIGWFDAHESGALTTRLADDIERIKAGLGDKLSLFIQFICAFIAGFTIGFYFSWQLTLVMMSLTPLMAACASFISIFISKFSTMEQKQYATAGSIAEEVFSCMRTVAAFNGQTKEITRYCDALEEGKALGIKKSILAGAAMFITMVVIFSSYSLAFWYGSILITDEKISAGTVFTVFFAVMIGSFSLGNAAPHLSTIATAKGSAAAVYNIIDREPAIDAYGNMGKIPRRSSGRIVFQTVSFNYPTRPDVPVLQNFNLLIKPGQTVALVGASGSGKSTVINLLLRFYDPAGGQIYIDEEEIQSLNLLWLRNEIGVVSQEPVLFGCSIAENIRYGRQDITDAEMKEAAKAANAHDFISHLPEGYDTLVGERGAQLSGGQKQRVALARALARNPRILLLDEATSALDATSEKVVQEALDKAREGRTTIVVAHRLSTIQAADQIVTIEEGRVVEQGTHKELMEKQGVYRELVTLQTMEGMDENMASYLEKKTRTKSLTRMESEAPLTRSLSKEKSKDQEKLDEEEAKGLEEATFAQMLKANAPEWPYIVAGSIASAIVGCAMPVFAVFYSEIFKVFGSTDYEQLKIDARFWSLMFLVLAFVQGACYFVSSAVFGTSGEKMTMRLRLQTFTNILRQDIGWFDDSKHSTGKLTTRLATDAPIIKGATGVRIATVLQAIVTMIAGLVIAFAFGWKLALGILASVPILALAGYMQMKAVMGNQKRDSALLEEAGNTASEAVENIRTVQALTRERTFYETYCRHLEHPYKESKKQALIYALAFAFSQGVIFVIYGGAFWFGSYLVGEGEMEPFEVYRVFFAIAFCGISIGQASSFLPDYSKAKLSATLVFDLINTEPVIDSYSAQGTKVENLTGAIHLEKVRFCYPTRPDATVLKNISLSVEPGQTLALVGSSGCGKSTITHLLLRFYDPQEGYLAVDGYDVRFVNIGWLRSVVSIVSQEPVLFDTTISKNINYGVEEELPHEDIVKAAKIANIHEFIMTLPDQYSTVVGEKGTQLSGGQKQRIAIARALVRHPTILILDEATSALDTESERIVQDALDRAREGRTCIIVAHRLSTVQNADRIAVIDAGSIVEIGTHMELLAMKGVYYNLTANQRINSS